MKAGRKRMPAEKRESRQQWKKQLGLVVADVKHLSTYELLIHINDALRSLSSPAVEVNYVHHWLRIPRDDSRDIRVPLSEGEANALVYGLDKCGVWKDREASRLEEMRRLVETLGYQLKVVPDSRALFIDEWLSNPLTIELGLWSLPSAKNHLTQSPDVFDKILKYVQDKPLFVISVSGAYGGID